MDDVRQPPMGLPPVSPQPSLNERMIGETIAILLSHYGSSDMHPALREGQARDWLEDLREFPSGTVKEAVKRWRQSPEAATGKRPLPANIRSHCVDLRNAGEHRDALPAPDSELQHRRQQMFLAFGRWDAGWGPRPYMPGARQHRDWSAEAMPAQDVVRAYYREIPAVFMTDAERALSLPEIQARTAAALANLGDIKRVPIEPGDGMPRAREVPTRPLPDLDDPRVQAEMRKLVGADDASDWQGYRE